MERGRSTLACLAAAVGRGWLASSSSKVSRPGHGGSRQRSRGGRARRRGGGGAPRILAADVALVVMAHVDALGEMVDPLPVAAVARAGSGRDCCSTPA